MLTMATNAITLDMQLHAAKYNGACHLPPRWYVMKYWAVLACHNTAAWCSLVAWHWGASGPCRLNSIPPLQLSQFMTVAPGIFGRHCTWRGTRVGCYLAAWHWGGLTVVSGNGWHIKHHWAAYSRVTCGKKSIYATQASDCQRHSFQYWAAVQNHLPVIADYNAARLRLWCSMNIINWCSPGTGIGGMVK